MKQLFSLFGSALALGVVASPAAAQQDDGTPMLDRGTRELSLAGRIEAPGLDQVDYDLDASYGYFFRDGWEIGAQVSGSDFGGTDRFDISGFTEYNFMRDSNLVPYVGGGIGLASVDVDEGIGITTPLDDDGVVFDVEGGVKWFVRDYMAISSAIDFKFSPDDIFATDEEIEDNLTSIKLGMRYYF